METESKALATLQSKTQERSDSTDALIREWLFRFGVEHKEDIAPRLPLWLEAFGEMDAGTLEKLFRRAMRSCKFFPRVAEILEPIESSPLGQAEAELKWALVLDYCRIYVTPDLSVPSYAPKITERTMTTMRTAGGLHWIQSCGHWPQRLRPALAPGHACFVLHLRIPERRTAQYACRTG